MNNAYLLTGSNQGDRSKNLQKAVSYLEKLAGEVKACSPVFESPAWGFDHPTPFLNQALELHTKLSPGELLHLILSIEDKCGRTRKRTDEYEARTLDIDILFYDDLIIDSPELVIPHPRLHLRRFVLMPMAAISAHYYHPLLKKTITELLSECTDTSIVEQYKDFCCHCCQDKEASA